MGSRVGRTYKGSLFGGVKGVQGEMYGKKKGRLTKRMGER